MPRRENSLSAPWLSGKRTGFKIHAQAPQRKPAPRTASGIFHPLPRPTGVSASPPAAPAAGGPHPRPHPSEHSCDSPGSGRGQPAASRPRGLCSHSTWLSPLCSCKAAGLATPPPVWPLCGAGRASGVPACCACAPGVRNQKRPSSFPQGHHSPGGKSAAPQARVRPHGYEQT